MNVTAAPILPYIPGAPQKYRRADVAPPVGMDDVEEILEGENDEAFAMSGTVPLHVTRKILLDVWA